MSVAASLEQPRREEEIAAESSDKNTAGHQSHWRAKGYRADANSGDR